MTCSTSPPSNPSDGSPRTSTSPSAAPSPAPSSARSSPPPTTRSGGPSTESRQVRRRAPAGLGRAHRHLPRPGYRRGPADLGRGARRHRRPRTSRWHVARFGDRFDAQGVLAGSKDASRCIGYLTKYLTKHLGRLPPGRHRRPSRPRRPARRRAAVRAVLADVRELAPLRHPAQERPARPAPGRCKGKAHRREYLGYAGRRVLVSRKWSGKTLADHRADRKTWLTGTLGLPATDPARYAWEPVTPGDPDHMPNAPAAAARRRRPHPMASRARRGQTTSRRRR